MSTATETEVFRRSACLLMIARPGSVNAARSLVGRAIRKALGIRAWRQMPHCVVYYGEDSEGDDFTARYILNVSNAEMVKVLDVGHEMAVAEGWSCFPVDCYHD